MVIPRIRFITKAPGPSATTTTTVLISSTLACLFCPARIGSISAPPRSLSPLPHIFPYHTYLPLLRQQRMSGYKE